jgi:Fur family iron response transcriptional regulator
MTPAAVTMRAPPSHPSPRPGLSDVSRPEPVSDCADLLRRHGLRPTRQRLMLGRLLFGGGRHLTAEMLHAEAAANDMAMSLGTVYNTLHQFTRAGLLRQIGVDGSKSFFDTNPGCHPHFFVAGEDRLFDTPSPVVIEKVPAPLPGYEISSVDIVIHLRRKTA